MTPTGSRGSVRLSPRRPGKATRHDAALTLGWSPTVRAAVTIGFIGGLTTYSSFNYETVHLFEESAPTAAVLNLAVTMLGGLMAGWLGLTTAREVLGR